MHSHKIEIGISIDGPENITNANRFYHDNRGAYADAMRAIEICKKLNVPFGLSVTLSEAAVQNRDALMQFLRDVAPQSIGFNIMMGDGGARSFYARYDEDAADFLIEAFQEFRQTGMPEDRMMRKVRAFSNHEVYAFDCGATGGSQLVFAPSGQQELSRG